MQGIRHETIIGDFVGVPEQIAAVIAVSEDVYRDFAEERSHLPENVHRGPFCESISGRMIVRLRELEVSASWRFSSNALYKEKGINHVYVDLGNGWVAEPT